MSEFTVVNCMGKQYNEPKRKRGGVMHGQGGYAGKIAVVNLSEKTIFEYHWGVEDQLAQAGGKALAAALLMERLTGKETAFSEENPVVVATGPLTGSGAPASSRFDVATLSPKDNLPAFSNCGGDFGVCLKKAGYDALVLEGRSEMPCWVEISEDGIVFHDAKALWGAGTAGCREKLAECLGNQRFGSLCIGPAGENLVKFASVMSNGHSAGRAGIGAVLGWKNVKAITVSGNRQIPVFDPEMAVKWNKEWHAFLKQSSKSREDGGYVCPGCPLHCRKHAPGEDERWLNELGLDAIAAKDAIAWATAEGIPTEGLYEKIAFRTDVGERLADGVPGKGKKAGSRRGGSHRKIAEAFGLSGDDPETAHFCKAMTEAVSLSGQCMLTMSALPEEDPLYYIRNLLFAITGRRLEKEDLFYIGQHALALEQQLRERFQ